MKIVYNAKHGGFGLSDAAIKRYAELKGLTLYPEKNKFGMITYWTVPPDRRPKVLDGQEWYSATQEQRAASNAAYSASVLYDRDIKRSDPDLVRVVEELGEGADGDFARLKIASIPRGSRYRIDEYDGYEAVETPDDIA